jgi:hypothetical protein
LFIGLGSLEYLVDRCFTLLSLTKYSHLVGGGGRGYSDSKYVKRSTEEGKAKFSLPKMIPKTSYIEILTSGL